MKKVFLSRPTCILPEYQKGMEGFIGWLTGSKLEPMTLGVTHYSNVNPMSAVINLIKKCDGVIVLGIPQITITGGRLKGKKIKTPVSLATEWNHIEAAIAFSLKKPILIIRDNSVERGIFDKGAAEGFLHSTDFKKPKWVKEKNINKVLIDWKDKI